MTTPSLELVDTLTLADTDSMRIVAKTYRGSPRASYAETVSAATEAGWTGEPAGRRSSRIRDSWRDHRGWTLTIEFTVEKRAQ